MRLRDYVLLIATLFWFRVGAQNMSDYTHNWEGKIENPKAFNLEVKIEFDDTEQGSFEISNDKSIIHYPFIRKNQLLTIPFSKDQLFVGTLSESGESIRGFIKSGLLLYHLELIKSKNNSLVGMWNILMVDELKSKAFYLSVENGLNDDYEAYPFFGDNRFTGTWCTNFQKENDQIFFNDFKTGLSFKGELFENEIRLEILLGSKPFTQIFLKASESDWEFGGLQSENRTSILKLSEMENLISKDSFPNTHSVLISKNGKLIYEKYFDGYNSNIPHDMRSASKSISSALVGMAKDNSLFESVDQSIFDFLPQEYQSYQDSLKADIDIQSLLTMSSGLDAVDFGNDRESLASEDNYQPTQDWTKTILQAPMINLPNTHANYGSANPYLLGVAMDSMVSEPLEMFIDKNLFEKLNITDYIIQTDVSGRPYFGGGMYLRPMDMLKFGELYLNNGNLNGNQILSENWINYSFQNYLALENTADKNGYGYLWWHNTYHVNGKSIKSIEARGAGGQYIFVVPDLKTVAVITSGNYRNTKTQQPEMIFENQILPNIIN